MPSCIVCFEAKKENNLSPYHYLRYLFEALPNVVLNNKEDMDEILPSSVDSLSNCRVPKLQLRYLIFPRQGILFMVCILFT
nr:transposase domain-containing protein [Bacillus sp. CDB3]